MWGPEVRDTERRPDLAEKLLGKLVLCLWISPQRRVTTSSHEAWSVSLSAGFSGMFFDVFFTLNLLKTSWNPCFLFKKRGRERTPARWEQCGAKKAHGGGGHGSRAPAFFPAPG